MAQDRAEFDRRVSELKVRLAGQGRAVQRVMERAVDAAFARDAAGCLAVAGADHAIDREDVEIEREAVALLAEASASGVRVETGDVRLLLTIVKVNNEFERIADCAVTIADRAPAIASMNAGIPPKFRVMANSVIGIMQTTNVAFAQLDRVAAELVLASDDATDAFARAILEDTLEEMAQGQHTVPLALALQTVAASMGRMADHCTNVAEQVIYLMTGKIVRHEGDRWGKPEDVV